MKKVYFVPLLLVVGYTLACLSPLSHSIARRSPRVAALFSPPLFNMGETYTNGTALEFTVGMNRNEVAHVLRSVYARDWILQGGCGEDKKFGSRDIEIDSAKGEQALVENKTFCLLRRSRKASVVLSIETDTLKEIAVIVVNNGI